MTQSGGTGAQMEELDLFYEEVKKSHSSPLWTIDQPGAARRVLPFLWRWQDFRPLMHKAARLVPIEKAERRVLVFANPGLTDARRPGATTTLFANLQIINPGEIARTHRHSASALRLVVEGKGAWTAVEGEKSYMEPGDFVTTPNWTWHDHGHEGDEPMVWLDGLDIPVVQAMEVSFYELAAETKQQLTKPDDVSLRLYGAGSLRPTWTR
ncbi:MAG: cupin domain-containing protein, partial [Dehalococcoidia bacterium]